MYKDKEKQREAARERIRRYRDKQKGVTSEGVTNQGVTPYHPILDDLVDPVRRKKLEAICEALKRRKDLSGKVFYGIGENGLPMDVVGDLLDATG